jgi:pSer/pThr/pTyr-binding forkhead associated (FHA) protein
MALVQKPFTAKAKPVYTPEPFADVVGDMLVETSVNDDRLDAGKGPKSMARLILRSSEGDQEFPIEGDEVTIGRQGCTITIDDTKSSRKHCLVRFQAGGFMLEDLNSSNGTQLNGASVAKRALMGGDVITIGRTEIAFQLDVGEEDMSGSDVGGGGATGEESCLLIPDDGGMPIPIVGTVSIGRAPGNTLVIDDTKASSKHCEVFVEGGVGMIRDLDSSNGTRVDGQKITETPLRQGAKIVIGKTAFIFKNPTLPDDMGESDMLESSALGADFAVVGKRANRRSMVKMLSAFVLIGGVMGGAVWVSQNLGAETKSGIQSPSGNKTDVNYSFEDGADFDTPPGWSANLEGEDSLRVAKGGKSGTYRLTMTRVAGSPADSFSECTYAKDISVGRGKAIRVTGQIRNDGTDAVATLRIVWLLAKGNGPVEQSVTELVSDSGGWTKVDATFAPPRDAIAKARISCALLGKEGEASFDDIEVYQVSRDGTPPRIDGARVGYDLDEHGRWRLNWGEQGGQIDQQVAWQGAVIALNDSGVLTTEQGVALIAGAAKGDAGLAVQGKLFEAASGKWYPFATAIRDDNGKLVLDITVGDAKSAPAFAGFTCLFRPLRVRQGVGIIDAAGYSAVAREFLRGDVEQLISGAPHNRVALRFTPPVQARVRDDNGTYRLSVVTARPAEGGPITLSMSLQAEFEEERNTAEGAREEAKLAHRDGRLGVAHTKYDAIVDQYGPIRHVAGDAEVARKALDDQFAAEIKDLRRRHDEALFPQPSVAALEIAVRRGQALKDTWTGSAFATEVEAVVEAANKDLLEAKIAAGERNAEALLARAKDYFNKLRQNTLALIFAEKVVRDFPGTPWAEDAAKLVEKAKAELKKRKK